MNTLSLKFSSASVIVAILASACSQGDREFRISQHPMESAKVMNAILPAMRRPARFTARSSTRPALEIYDASDPMNSVKGIGEEHGEEWLFPGNEPGQALRVHLIYGEFNAFDTRFHVRVEVREPYEKVIDGKRVKITQQYADQRLQAAFGEMVDAINGESWRQIRFDPEAPAKPVVAALRELVPWDANKTDPTEWYS